MKISQEKLDRLSGMVAGYLETASGGTALHATEAELDQVLDAIRAGWKEINWPAESIMANVKASPEARAEVARFFAHAAAVADAL